MEYLGIAGDSKAPEGVSGIWLFGGIFLHGIHEQCRKHLYAENDHDGDDCSIAKVAEQHRGRNPQDAPRTIPEFSQCVHFAAQSSQRSNALNGADVCGHDRRQEEDACDGKQRIERNQWDELKSRAQCDGGDDRRGQREEDGLFSVFGPNNPGIDEGR